MELIASLIKTLATLAPSYQPPAFAPSIQSDNEEFSKNQLEIIQAEQLAAHVRMRSLCGLAAPTALSAWIETFVLRLWARVFSRQLSTNGLNHGGGMHDGGALDRRDLLIAWSVPARDLSVSVIDALVDECVPLFFGVKESVV